MNDYKDLIDRLMNAVPPELFETSEEAATAIQDLMAKCAHCEKLNAEQAEMLNHVIVERDGLSKQVSSYKTLTKSLEDQVNEHRRNADRYQEAVRTLQSERDANTLLTEELAELKAKIASDSYAISFQTLGQYRSALLEGIKE